MNRVQLKGNLGRDAEILRLENGTPVAKFCIATSERYKDTTSGEWKDGDTEWHDVVAWRTLAETAEKSLKKGVTVFVEGKLTHRKYTDKNGIDRYLTEVVASSILIAERNAKRETNFPSEPPLPNYNRSESRSYPNNQAPTPQPNNQAVPFEVIEPSNTNSSASPELVGEDGLPF
jgi:single-strand DNA-binding protein